MKAHRPILHGRDHLASGADPIPGLLPPGATYDAAIVALPDLVGYWKLNEATGDWADSSGLGNDLAHTSRTGELRAVGGAVNEGDGILAVHVDGGDGGSAKPASFVGSRTDLDFEFAPTHPFTVIAWVNPDELPAATGNWSDGICGSVDLGPGEAAQGYGLYVTSAINPPSGHAMFRRRTPGGGSDNAIDPAVLTAGGWVMLAGVFTGTTVELYVNGLRVASDAATGSFDDLKTHSFYVGSVGVSEGIGGTWAPFQGSIDSVALVAADIGDQIYGLYNMAPVGASEGWVLGIDENGNPAWLPPTGVTVNGEPPAAASTPLPTPDPPPTDPGSGGPDLDDWIVDQPFTWGGAAFDVPPNKWTTIPFTSPLMERYSNVTGVGTTHTELDWDDPAAAGWIDPATPRAITIPHDMPFLGDPVSWWQICLRIEGPMVAATSSTRALRIFETTHQKALVSAWAEDRESACQEHGAINCYRDSAAPGWTPFDGEIFASGDTGGFDNGNHDTILFVPNSGFAFYLNGNDWLPKVDGVPTLKAGMRLVPQVWHDAPQTLTFHCDGTAPYRPHFVVYQTVQRGWGSPWSDWPTY